VLFHKAKIWEGEFLTIGFTALALLNLMVTEVFVVMFGVREMLWYVGKLLPKFFSVSHVPCRYFLAKFLPSP
jgi:hypothetical protein